MSSAHMPTPSRIVGEVLTYHPEAASLLGEASHRRALAAHSTATASQALYAEQATRVCYDELRHRLDPRNRRPVHFGAGLAILAGLGAGLAVVDGLELITVLPARMAVPITVASVAVWLTGAWLAALAAREGRRGLLAGIIAGAIVMSLLLIAIHGFIPFSNRPVLWGHIAIGALLAVLISALAVAATVVIARMEPASVFMTRRRWQRAHAISEAAVGVEQADAEAAAIAREAWLGLIRTQTSTIAADSGTHVLQDTLTLALALQETSRMHSGPAGTED